MSLAMTLAEADALMAWHRQQEAVAISRGAYLVAQRHKARVAEISRAFWPADPWERSSRIENAHGYG